jgi:hypothetical protein
MENPAFAKPLHLRVLAVIVFTFDFPLSTFNFSQATCFSPSLFITLT